MIPVGWRAAALCGLLVSSLFWTAPVGATPARIILLRHGEKGGPWTLCAVGRARAQALAAYYIGKNAQKSLFRPGEVPKAILGISLHTLETIYPVADSWSMPVTFYSVMPELVDNTFVIVPERLNQRTREAVRDIFEKPEWAGQTLVVNWEHDHIAKTALDVDRTAAEQDKVREKKAGHKTREDKKTHKDKTARADSGAAPGEKVTLYDLLGLSVLPDVPSNWPAPTYDYFWIIDFDQATGKPSAFSMVKQEFGPPYEQLPRNDWGAPEGKAADGCMR